MDYDYKYQKYKYKCASIGVMTGGAKKKNNDDDEIDIDMHKINEEIAAMFSYGCICVMLNLYNRPEDAWFNGKRITDRKLSEIILPETGKDKILIIPLGRSSDSTEYINVGTSKLSYRELFEKLYHYFNKVPIKMGVFEDMIDGMRELKERLAQLPIFKKKYKNRPEKMFKEDVKELRDLLKKNGKLFPVDVNGNLCRFEGVRKVSNYVYRVVLGS